MHRPLCLWVLLAASAYAGVSVDIRVGLGEFYRQPQHDIIVLEERSVPPDELPVVLFIAGRAHVPPMVIWEQRRSGVGWAHIAARYGITAEVLYVPISVDPGPPYGHAYGFYRRYPRHEWNRIRLDDNDIVALVNLRFYSEHYRLPPDRIVAWRPNGGPYYRVVEVANHEHWKDAHEREKAYRKAEHERDKDERKAWKEADKRGPKGRDWDDDDDRGPGHGRGHDKH